VLRTRSPLIPGPKPRSPFDLHVLSAPPAFVLSQDQTLRRDRSGVHEGRRCWSFWSGRVEEAPPTLPFPDLPPKGPVPFCCTVVWIGHGEPHVDPTRHWHSHAVQFSRCEWTQLSLRSETEPRAGNRADRVWYQSPRTRQPGRRDRTAVRFSTFIIALRLSARPPVRSADDRPGGPFRPAPRP
jgi:hypothetical protein